MQIPSLDLVRCVSLHDPEALGHDEFNAHASIA
jgi:hypothetical protein